MTVLQFTVLVWMGSFVAGFLGSLTGLGGGVVLVPLLTLVFKVDIRYAVGASLVSVIATSSGAAAAYVKEGFSNIRIGMFLEVATTIGALVGAFLATKKYIPVTKPGVINRRQGIPFWEAAANAGRKARVVHVPVTFPAHDFPAGEILAGLGVHSSPQGARRRAA